MEQPDKLTQTRGSIQANLTLFQRVSQIFCPCISIKRFDERNNSDYFSSNTQNSSRDPSVGRNAKQFEFQLPFKSKAQKISPCKLSSRDEKYSENDDTQSIKNVPSKQKMRKTSFEPKQTDLMNKMDLMAYTRKKQAFILPIYRLKQESLVLVGKHLKSLIVLISSKKLQPSLVSMQKQFQSKPSPSSENGQQIDNFWNCRYQYFQKFDQGIQIDKESIKCLTPEIVSDYIAGKCLQCKTVLDAFSGIGQHTTKLGTVCEKVICVEENSSKYNHLIHNSKCYQIFNIELFMKPFLDINLKNQIDVVLLHPPLSNQIYSSSTSIQSKHFKPNLSQIIKKSLSISNNIIMVLPPNINLNDVCYELSKSAQQTGKIFNSCSIKVQKIYFKCKLAYIAIFFGPNVQTQIQINQQLGFVYKMLTNNKQKHFQHKKLIKYVREKYGMIKLLNFISASKVIQQKNQSEMNKFVDYIRDKQLVSLQKLQTLLANDLRSSKKRDSNTFTNTKGQDIQDKIIQDDEQQYQTQRTQSFYSNNSGLSAFQQRKSFVNMYGQSSIKSINIQSYEDTSFQSSIRIKKQTEDSFQSSIRVKKQTEDSFQSSIRAKKQTQQSVDMESKSPASPDIRNLKGNIVHRYTIDIKQIQEQIKDNKSLKKNLLEPK